MMQREPGHLQRNLRRVTAADLTVVCVLLVLVEACASSAGGAIPIDKLPPDPPAAQYTIGPGDVLNIQVFEQEKMSGQVRVRSDGRITIPLLSEIDAAAKTPEQLTTEVETALKKLILVPEVTITVVETRPVDVSIIGEVVKPGPLQLARGSGLAQALAAAGGLTTFADREKIFILRNTPAPTRIHVTYEAITRAQGRAATFQLRPGDVIVVE
jgi:polysaccharide export outer membrane protein